MHKPAIFVFTTAYHPFVGGAELAVKETTKRLKDSFRFFIITARMRRDLPKVEEREEGTILRIGFGAKFDRFLLPFFGALATLRLMRRARPALFWPVMVTYASGIPYIINTLRFWDRTPVLLTLQEGDSEAHIAHNRLGLISLSWRLALRRTDSLHTISAYLARLAERYGYRGTTKIVPNGVEISQFGRVFEPREWEALRRTIGINKDERVIITTSRLVKKNAVDVLIRAFHELRQNDPHFSAKLLILGDGEKREELEALTRELDLGRNVFFLGTVPNADIPRYLSIADVYARPSRSEGLGSAFLEAMAAGVPVVATPVGGIPDFLHDGENGLFSTVDDPVDLAAKLKSCITDRTLREKLIRNARATVAEDYQWDGIAEKFESMFLALARRASGGAILIATPLYPPAVGGPATYAEHLAHALLADGAPVSVLTYARVPVSKAPIRVDTVFSGLPSGVKHFVYFWKAFAALGRMRHSAVFIFDPFIVGVPALLACILRRVPALVRVEGDFVWESYIERTQEDRTLTGFYEALPRLRLSPKERIAYSLSRFVFRRAARLVFSSEWRKRIFERGYNVLPYRSVIIPSPLPQREEPAKKVQKKENVFLFAGRLVQVKNLIKLIRAFAGVAGREWRLEIIGDGPLESALNAVIRDLGLHDRVSVRPSLSHPEILERLASAHACVLPSLSDVSPNIILECIKTRTPFIMTRESGLYEQLKDVGVFIDPLNEDDIRANLREMTDPVRYAAALRRLAEFHIARSWADTAKAWRALIVSTS